MYGSPDPFELEPGMRAHEHVVNTVEGAGNFFASFITLGAVALEQPAAFTHQSARMAFALEATPAIESAPRTLSLAPRIGGLSLDDARRGLDVSGYDLPLAA